MNLIRSAIPVEGVCHMVHLVALRGCSAYTTTLSSGFTHTSMTPHRQDIAKQLPGKGLQQALEPDLDLCAGG
ncbi:hypothetical protein E2C01_035955 [Portunus trituberculatus]|uniref:Uncharacterized protein n=1 Tax=Portunus trituberculatus TaxID=210409 RepID=A0A5B7F9S3_PORTR|nr:hypothetical protein [Portunus trituberculatus]